MKYILVEKQSGGCDYTIGCGLRITELAFVQSVEEAKAKAAEEIGDYWQGQNECGSAYLTKAAQTREAARKVKEAKDREKAELETLERLAKKHGKSVQ